MTKPIFITILTLLMALPVSADQAGSIFSREIRREAQEALSYYGFDAGPADGIFGSQTRAAISAYQATNGGSPTGEFSRAGLGNLLQRYREDLRKAQTSAAGNGLPAPVVGAISGMAEFCDVTPNAMAARPGFLQTADLNNDGITDYLLDGSAAGCNLICGAANCEVAVIVSTSRGYRQNDFLGGGITPESFNCLSDGQCEFARR